MDGATIKKLRKQKGLTQPQLAELAGTDVSSISRYERGLRGKGISISNAEKLAMALGTSTAVILGIEEQKDAGPSGFSDDIVPYQIEPGDRYGGLVGPNRHLWTVVGNVLDNIGIGDGAVVVVDASQKARDALEPLQAVQVAFHSKQEPHRAIQLLRQFVPPSLLITNSSEGNLPSLDMNEDDAQIIAVIDSIHTRPRLPKRYDQ